MARKKVFVRGVERPNLPKPEPSFALGGLEPFYTYEEAAHLCFRSVSRIKHIVANEKLPRRLVKVRPHTYFIALPPETVNYLRIVTLGF